MEEERKAALISSSSDEEVQEEAREAEADDTLVNESGGIMSWIKWLGSVIYHGMYEAGGFLADLFGITTPRYDYIIREYERRLEAQQAEERLRAGENEPDIENIMNDEEIPEIGKEET